MRLALAQTNIIWEDKETNLNNVEEVLRLTGEKAQLVLFPEMSLTGFSMNTSATAEADRKTVHEIEGLSEKYNISIGIGWVKQGEVLCENHYSIISAGIGELSDYTKLHPFSYSGEDRFFTGGEKLTGCRLHNMNIATAICYDLRFPEIFQIMSTCTDLIIVPANWPAKRREHWQTLLKARAIENQCYIAGVNCCGIMNGLEYSGDSGLYAPDGSLIAPADIIKTGRASGEQILIYDISNDVESYRKAFPVKNDRRNELYKKLNTEINGLDEL